jgi:hypothetical protein
MKSKKSIDKFYLQDLLDDIARADAKWFSRLCEQGVHTSSHRSAAKDEGMKGRKN